MRPLMQQPGKRIKQLIRPDSINLNTPIVKIPHKSSEPQLRRMLLHEISKPDALHPAMHAETPRAHATWFS